MPAGLFLLGVRYSKLSSTELERVLKILPLRGTVLYMNFGHPDCKVCIVDLKSLAESMPSKTWFDHEAEKVRKLSEKYDRALFVAPYKDLVRELVSDVEKLRVLAQEFNMPIIVYCDSNYDYITYEELQKIVEPYQHCTLIVRTRYYPLLIVLPR